MLAFATYGYGIAMVFLTGFLLGRAMRLAMRLIAFAVCLVDPPLLAWTFPPHVLDHGLEIRLAAIMAVPVNLFAIFVGGLWQIKSRRVQSGLSPPSPLPL